MPQIKKQISVVLISLLFLLSIVPFVNASPATVTFNLPYNDSRTYGVDLNRGDPLKVDVIVLWGFDNDSLGSSSMSLEIKDPNGNAIRNYDIYYDAGVNSRTYSFSASDTGKYLFIFRDTSSVPVPEKTVTFAPTISPYNPILIGNIMAVIGIVMLAVVILAVTYKYKKIKRQKAISKSTGQDNLPDSSVYQEMLEKRAREIIGIKDSANVSWEDSKRGMLLCCKNAWLSNTELFYRPSYFPISNMAEALVNENNVLTIKLRNGETKEFKLSPDNFALELTNKLAVLNNEFAKDTFKAYLKAKNQQWADTINKLIHENLESHIVTCEYCGAKNKDTNSRCDYCGANL